MKCKILASDEGKGIFALKNIVKFSILLRIVLVGPPKHKIRCLHSLHPVKTKRYGSSLKLNTCLGIFEHSHQHRVVPEWQHTTATFDRIFCDGSRRARLRPAKLNDCIILWSVAIYSYNTEEKVEGWERVSAAGEIAVPFRETHSLHC